MTDLVRYEGPPRETSLELAPRAWKLAEKIADTDFVPKSLRGRKEAVLACILTGHEVGLPPMASLAQIHIIDGRKAMGAEAMRALVIEHGHTLDFEAVSNTAVTVVGKRAGGTRELRVTWTMDDARLAGLIGKDNWRKYPRAMLIARATAELCRMMFPDVLAGISHTVEELSDGDLLAGHELGAPPEAPPAVGAPTATARAGKAITRPAPADDPAPAPAPTRGEIPPLPGEEEEPITDAEIVETEGTDADDPVPGACGDPACNVLHADPANPIHPPDYVDSRDEDWPAGDWPTGDDRDPANVKRYTGPQLIAIKLHDLFEITGSSAEARRARLDAIETLIGRPIDSSKDLTDEETSNLLATLEAWPKGEPLPTDPGTTETDGEGSSPQSPATAETEPATVEPSPSPPAPAPPADPPKRARPGTLPPEQWDADKWRATLRDRGVKVTEAMREAQRLGGAATPAVSIGTLDDVAGSGIAADLLGYIEDLSLERKGPAK